MTGVGTTGSAASSRRGSGILSSLFSFAVGTGGKDAETNTYSGDVDSGRDRNGDALEGGGGADTGSDVSETRSVAGGGGSKITHLRAKDAQVRE